MPRQRTIYEVPYKFLPHEMQKRGYVAFSIQVEVDAGIVDIQPGHFAVMSLQNLAPADVST